MINDDYKKCWDDLISVMTEEQVIRFMYRLSKRKPYTEDTIKVLQRELEIKEHEYSR